MENRTEETHNLKDRKQPVFYFWIHSAIRKYVEVTMDLILVSLVLVTFIFIIKTIYFLGIEIYRVTNIPHVISEFLFIFILIELLRILIVYIEHHHVSVDIMVELAIVAILREIMLKGAVELETIKIAGISLLIAILGLLLKFGDIRVKAREEPIAYKPFFQTKELKHKS